MADDIARLGFEVDTKSLEKGLKSLGLLRKESDKSEKSNNVLNKSFEDLNKKIEKTNDTLKDIGSGLNKASQAISKLKPNIDNTKNIIESLDKNFEKLNDKLDSFKKKTTKAKEENKNLKMSFEDLTSSLRALNIISKKTESVLNTLNNSFKKLSVQIVRAKKGFIALKNTTVMLGKTLRGTIGIIGKIFKSFFNLKSLLVGLGVGLIAKNFIDAAASAERLRIRLDAFTKGQGAAYFEKLNKWAALLPVNTEEAVQVFTKLQAYGLEPTTELMTTLVDTTTALGGEADSLSGIARALGQIETKGRVSAEEINQLAEQGVNARKYLKEAFGLIPSDFNEIDAAVKKSGHSTGEAIQAIIAGMKGEFGGMADRIKNSWQGLMNRLKHQWFNFRRITTEKGIFQTIKQELQEFLEFLESPAGTKAMESWAQKLSDIIFDASIFMINSLQGVIRAVGGIGTEIKRLAIEFKKLPLIGDKDYRKYISAKQVVSQSGMSIGEDLSGSGGFGGYFLNSKSKNKVVRNVGEVLEALKVVEEYESQNPFFKESTQQVESFGSSAIDVLEDLKNKIKSNRELFKGGISGDGDITPPSKKDIGLIPQKVYQIGEGAFMERGLKDWITGAKTALTDYSEMVADVASQTSDVFNNAFSSMENSLVEFVQTGKASFKDFASSVIGDIARILYRQSILGPLAQGMGAMFTGGQVQTTYYPTVSSGFHSGGIVGSEPSFSRNVDPNIFQGATKYHSGGIVGDEVPAILKRGEGVFTEGQMKAMGGNTNIQIIDQRSNSNSEQITTEESTGADGQRLIRVMVRDEVRAGTNNGVFDSTFRGNMGLSRKPVRR